jgi:hypothetical protein
VNLPPLKPVLLRASLALRRLGWGNTAAMLLSMLALAAWTVPLPRARHELEDSQRTVERARAAVQEAGAPKPAAALSTNEERLAAFYQALGERRYAEQQVKTLFALAEKNGLVLNQGEYRLASVKDGHFDTYQVTLPVKGSYGAVHKFYEQVLLAIPFASLDQMNFKRDTISSSAIEAQLRFTLYLGGGRNTLAGPAEVDE